MELDNSQLLFIENFKENLRIFNNDFLILSGPAGTGKTEVIKESAKICEFALIISSGVPVSFQ